MNLETYQELMATLPGAFPASGRVEIEAVKKAWWSDVKDVSDADFIEAMGRVRRSGGNFFPSLGTMLEAVKSVTSERSERELEERLAEHRRKKQETIGQYIPKDLPDPTDKQMAKDTFKAIQDGLSSGPSGLVEELRKLADKYPKKRDWFNHTAFFVEQDHKETMERDGAVNGAHKCPQPHKSEAVIPTAKTCQKCQVAIEKGLWCEPCRTALYKAKEAVLTCEMAERIGND